MPRTRIEVEGENVSAANPLPASVSVPLPTTFPSFGQKAVTTAGTRVALVASSTPLAEGWAYITPYPSNTGVIYVGDVTITGSGVSALASNTNVWLINQTNGDKVVNVENTTHTLGAYGVMLVSR